MTPAFKMERQRKKLGFSRAAACYFSFIARILLLDQMVWAQTDTESSLPLVAQEKNNITVGPTLCAGGSDERFDPIGLSCELCSGENQQLSDDGLNCECDSESIIINNDMSFLQSGVIVPVECQKCAEGMIPSEDKFFCIVPNNCTQVTRDRNEKGRVLAKQSCLACIEDDRRGIAYRPSTIAGGTCVPCPSPNMTFNEDTGNCECVSGFELANDGRCFPVRDPPDTFNFQLTYTDGTVIDRSQVLVTLLQSAFDSCKKTSEHAVLPITNTSADFSRNETACQVLANLCVLAFYDTSTSGGPCDKYLELVGTGSAFHGNQNRIPEWPAQLPWLYYTMQDGFPLNAFRRSLKPNLATDVELKATYASVDEVDSSRSNANVEDLQFKVAVYDLYGRFLRLADFPNEVQVCPSTEQSKRSWLSFGQSYDISCSLSLDDLVFASQEHGSVLLYEPYLVDRSFDNDIWSDILYPVPVLLKDYVHVDGIAINQGDEQHEDVLFTRRFMIVDNVSSIRSNQAEATVARIASTISMDIRLRSGEGGKIYPPVLSVTYEHVQLVDGKLSSPVEMKFEANYHTDLNGLENRMEAIIGICVSISVTIAYIRSKTTKERDRRVTMDLWSFIKIVLELGAAISTFFFIVLCGTSLYFLIFSKGGGDDVFVLPPKNDEVEILEIMLIVGFVFKLLQVMELIYSQAEVDMFFIDWEMQKTQQQQQQKGPRATQSITNDDFDRPVQDTGESISAWRRLFVANEWNELQSAQQISVDFVIVLVLLFLFPADAKSLASENSDVEDEPQNKVLRLGVAAMLFLPIVAVIWGGKTLIYNRFIYDALGQFEDLCSLCNISLLVLTNNCFGYYVHGRSVHGRAEVSLSEIRAQLEREAQGHTGRRGLLPESDNQVFEIHIPWSIRERWDTTLLLSLREQAQGRPMVATAAAENARAYDSLNQFFIAFFNHAFLEDLDWVVKDRPFGEYFLGMTPPVSSRAVLYVDKFRGYANTILWGHQATMLMMVFYLFALTDWFAEDWILAAVVAILANKFFEAWKGRSASKNLSQKALIDPAFLL